MQLSACLLFIIFIYSELLFCVCFQYVKEDAFFENPFVYRLLYMTAMFFVFRMRLYVAWTLAGICIVLLFILLK